MSQSFVRVISHELIQLKPCLRVCVCVHTRGGHRALCNLAYHPSNTEAIASFGGLTPPTPLPLAHHAIVFGTLPLCTTSLPPARTKGNKTDILWWLQHVFCALSCSFLGVRVHGRAVWVYTGVCGILQALRVCSGP